MSLGIDAIRNSKDTMVKIISHSLTDANIDNFNINFMGEAQFNNVKFHSIDINKNDVEVELRGNKIHVHVRKLGGRLTGHGHKKVLLSNENFDFNFNMKPGGGILTLDYEI